MAKPTTMLAYFFHLPTLIVLATIGLVLILSLYDVGFSAGNGFFRLNTNQGNLGIYWAHGCCDINW